MPVAANTPLKANDVPTKSRHAFGDVRNYPQGHPLERDRTHALMKSVETSEADIAMVRLRAKSRQSLKPDQQKRWEALAEFGRATLGRASCALAGIAS